MKESPDILLMWSVFCAPPPPNYGSYLHTQLKRGKEKTRRLIVVLPFSAASEEIVAACDSDPNQLELARLYNEVNI